MEAYGRLKYSALEVYGMAKTKGGRQINVKVGTFQVKVKMEEYRSGLFLRQAVASGTYGPWTYDADNLIPAGVIVSAHKKGAEDRQFIFTMQALVKAALDFAEIEAGFENTPEGRGEA